MYIVKKHPIILSLLLSTCICTTSLAITTSDKSNYFSQAEKVLQASEQAKQQSREAMLAANRLRKRVIAERSKIRKAQTPEEKQALAATADELTQELNTLQERGASLRDKEKQQEKHALDLLELGLINEWGEHIRSRNPILMGDNTTLFFAHNTQFRSVHPNMLNKMGSAEDVRVEKTEDMSLLVPALAGQNAPPELDISSFQISREKKIFSHIEVKSNDNDPLSALVPPNEIHSWLLMLSDIHGNPVEQAKIDVIGHMPGHVHGLPTQPRVTREIAPGIYVVDGMKFQMKGWWVMQFTIEAERFSPDAVTFNLVL